MSKCIKCGSALPAVGECPRCASVPVSPSSSAPSVLGKELGLDRRRDREPPPIPAPVRKPATMTSAPPTMPATPPPSQPPRSASRAEGPNHLRAAPASLWRRLFASTVDILLVGAVLALYLLAASAVVGGKAPPTQLSGLDGLMSTAHRLQPVLIPGIVLAVVLALAYSATFALVWNGRTPGRVVAGIRLVDQSGLPPAPTRAVVRALLSLVSFAAFLGGFWLALFDRRGQTLHDKLTRTFVVRPI